MRASRYNLFVEADDGSIYAVNTMSRAAMTMSPESFDVYQALVRGDLAALDPCDPQLPEFLLALRQGMFVVPDDFDELAHVRAQVQHGRFGHGQLGLVIAPTLACNFSCHYCFENHSEVQLDASAQERIVDLVQERLEGKQELGVQWFGGEPLLALPLIEALSRRFLELCAQRGVAYSATVVTNGYLLNHEVALALASLGVVKAQIPLDGDRPLHDRTRYPEPGRGSFDTILANVRAASGLLDIELRVHVGPFSVASVEQLIDTLGSEGIAPLVASLYFAPLFNYKAGVPNRKYLPDGKRFMSAEQFAEVQTELLRRAASWGFPLQDPLEASYGICTAVRDDTLVIDAEGQLFKCYKDVGVGEEAFASLDGSESQPSNLSKWMDLEIPRDQDCAECKFLPLCLGGCSKQWHEGASKDVICTPLKFNAADRLRLYFETEPTTQRRD